MTNKLGPYDLNTIVTGDARELAEAVPDESVDLIFTDPVYDRIDDYRWLAETAARVLRPDRACLVWCSHPMSAPIEYMFKDYLKPIYTLSYTVPAKPYRLNNYHIFLWTTPCLWFNKGHFAPSPWVPDTVISYSTSANGFKWNKNPEAMLSWLNGFCPVNGICLDFFTGSGTVPAVCKMLDRNYLAFEIDPATADAARQRVAMTQPPLFVPEPEQLNLDL